MKRCPFCGSTARLWGSDNVNGSPFYYVTCDNMDCMANTAGRPTKEQAIEVWERRANESPEPEIIP